MGFGGASPAETARSSIPRRVGQNGRSRTDDSAPALRRRGRSALRRAIAGPALGLEPIIFHYITLQPLTMLLAHCNQIRILLAARAEIDCKGAAGRQTAGRPLSDGMTIFARVLMAWPALNTGQKPRSAPAPGVEERVQVVHPASLSHLVAAGFSLPAASLACDPLAYAGSYFTAPSVREVGCRHWCRPTRRITMPGAFAGLVVGAGAVLYLMLNGRDPEPVQPSEA